jgi:hypothetical protein
LLAFIYKTVGFKIDWLTFCKILTKLEKTSILDTGTGKFMKKGNNTYKVKDRPKEINKAIRVFRVNNLLIKL